MIEILHFVFSSFWVFLGVMLLLGAMFNGVAKIIRALRRTQ